MQENAALFLMYIASQTIIEVLLLKKLLTILKCFYSDVSQNLSITNLAAKSFHHFRFNFINNSCISCMSLEISERSNEEKD